MRPASILETLQYGIEMVFPVAGRSPLGVRSVPVCVVVTINSAVTVSPQLVSDLTSVLLTRGIVVVEHGLCGSSGEWADAGAEGGEDRGGCCPSSFGEMVAVGAHDLVDQAMGAQQTELAAGPG